ncbi:hypothetical protein IKS_02824 [Bacillus cereus VDM062]|nr:hypothetical protein IKO_02289 [Bacillus cereus VDM034]EJS13700.1 hypothetical protein IKS_02824 [Bacillus cereus VDM062]
MFVVLKKININFTYRILKINIGKPKNNVEYIVHTYVKATKYIKEVDLCYLKK